MKRGDGTRKDCASGSVSPHNIFGGWTEAARTLFSRYPDGLRVLAAEYDLSNFPVAPKRLAKPGLEGRRRVLVAKALEWWGGASVVLCREMPKTDRPTLRATFESQQLFRLRTQFYLTLIDDLASAIALILATDAERMMRRASDLGNPQCVAIHIDGGELMEPFRSELLSAIMDRLVHRSVEIEPPLWEGPPAEIVLVVP
jgi:hypothetical protein